MSQPSIYRNNLSLLNLTKRAARRWVPQGSPLWFPYFFLKRCLLGKSVRNIAWYRIHGNILLDNYRAIYFDIPKVACSSLKQVWADVLQLSVDSQNLAEEIHLIHFPYVKTYQIDSRYADYFKFCFVRNPWDRLVSCYMDKIRDAQGGIYRGRHNPFVRYMERYGFGAQDLTFEEFVNAISEIPDEEAESHIMSQHRFIQDHRGNLLTDFVGRFDNLEADFQAVTKRLGISASLPHLRKTFRTDYRDYYNSTTRDKVTERYREDIELFSFTFSGQ